MSKLFTPGESYGSFILGLVLLNGYLAYYRRSKIKRQGKVMNIKLLIFFAVLMNSFYIVFSVLNGYVPDEVRSPIMRWLYDSN